RFSRRMSFGEYQRQIEIVNDPALIERWKEEARTVTTYTTSRDETPSTFASAAEAERHFQSNYLTGLVRSVEEVTIGGVLSRCLSDRALNRAIEDAWARETRSPSNMMQELAARFRQRGLNVFRHRRGMLFVSPIRMRAFVHEQGGVSPSVNAILEAVAATPGINRKDLAEKLVSTLSTEDAESRKLALASDLRWLISEGHVIEFNDGSLDLPRAKPKPKETAGRPYQLKIPPKKLERPSRRQKSARQSLAPAKKKRNRPELKRKLWRRRSRESVGYQASGEADFVKRSSFARHEFEKGSMLYENKNHHLLDDYGPHRARNLGGRRDGSRAWPNVGRFRSVRGRCNYPPWLRCVPSHDPRSVEAGWRCDLAGSWVSAAQGMGVCW